MRNSQASPSPPRMGVALIIVSAVIVSSILLLPGDQRTCWQAWAGAGVFFLGGVQFLWGRPGRASANGRTSSILAALICVGVAALFGPVASDLFRSTAAGTAHPLLAKIHILLILGIIAFLLLRAVYRAIFPPNHDDADQQ